MVKGMQKRIIVVKSPDPRIFDEAIFIIREDYLAASGADKAAVLKEAQRVAGEYMKANVPRHRRLLGRIPPAAAAAAGAVATGIAWLAMRFVGV